MLATQLKKLRVDKNFTQSDMANVLGITQQAVARWENGKSEPDVTTLGWLANFFHVTTDYLLGRESESVSEMTREERRLLTDYNSLTAEGKQTLLNVLSGLKITHSVGRQVP